jgi:AcrR family transcriptional regulator
MHSMQRPRLSGNDRRSSILAAASSVFAEYGFDGAKSQQIAAAAGVSEALIYRHFTSKEALYRAVLRRAVLSQNQSFAAFGGIEPSAAGLIAMIESSIRQAMRGAASENAEGMRLVFGSLARDGGYARLIYRRASRLAMPGLRAALAAAEAEGALEEERIAPENISALLGHIVSMMVAARLQPQPVIAYAGDDDRLLREAVWFCARGVGLRKEVIERHFAVQPDHPTASVEGRHRSLRKSRK